jgi:hypothetical protein
MGFMGAIYWFLPEEFGIEIAGIRAAEVLFYVFCAVVAVVADGLYYSPRDLDRLRLRIMELAAK